MNMNHVKAASAVYHSKRVFNSCKTPEQRAIAERFAELAGRACERYKQPHLARMVPGYMESREPLLSRLLAALPRAEKALLSVAVIILLACSFSAAAGERPLFEGRSLLGDIQAEQELYREIPPRPSLAPRQTEVTVYDRKTKTTESYSVDCQPSPIYPDRCQSVNVYKNRK